MQVSSSCMVMASGVMTCVICVYDIYMYGIYMYIIYTIHVLYKYHLSCMAMTKGVVIRVFVCHADKALG